MRTRFANGRIVRPCRPQNVSIGVELTFKGGQGAEQPPMASELCALTDECVGAGGWSRTLRYNDPEPSVDVVGWSGCTPSTRGSTWTT